MISDHLKPEARRRRYIIEDKDKPIAMSHHMSQALAYAEAAHRSGYAHVTVLDLATGQRLVSYEVRR